MIRATHSEKAWEKSAPEMEHLRSLSARIGRNPLRAQGSSGNTSIKIGGVLWIKASGKWLAQADREEIFVPLDLAEARRCVLQGRDIEAGLMESSRLRPSIETAMHAVLKQKVVLHVHSIPSIVWAIRRDAPEYLARRLAGLLWQWIPFVASGLPLANQIRERLDEIPEANVFILGNHGLVVAAEDCDTAEDLLKEVERRLEIEVRKPPVALQSILKRIAKPPHWRLPGCETIHILGTDVIARRALKGGLLYPCQEIFLGRAVPIPVHEATRLASAAKNGNAMAWPRFIIIQDAGVVVSSAISDAELAALRGLADVLLRTSEFTRLRYLTASEVAVIRSEGAEGYRASAMVRAPMGETICR